MLGSSLLSTHNSSYSLSLSACHTKAVWVTTPPSSATSLLAQTPMKLLCVYYKTLLSTSQWVLKEVLKLFDIVSKDRHRKIMPGTFSAQKTCVCAPGFVISKKTGTHQLMSHS